MRLNQVDEAESAFAAASELNPDDALSKLGMANVWRSRGKLKEAEATVDDALAISPETTQALLMKGELRRLSRDGEGALVSFEKAIELQPEDIRARLGRAAVLLDLGRDDDAKAELGRVDAQVPDFPMTLYLTAVLQAKQRDYAGAQLTLQQAGKTLATHLPSIFLLGSVHYAQGQFEQAVTHLQQFVNAVPRHVAARKLLGAALIRKNEPDVAVKVLRPAVEVVPNDPQLLGLMGNALMRNRQFTEATSFFEKAAAASPGSIPVQTQLALSQLATGAAGDAVANLEAALDADPEATRPGILLALTHLRSGQFDAAIEAADLLVSRLADNPLPYNLKGAAYLGKGDLDSARKTFEQALAIQSDYFPAEMNLAQMDIRAGDTAKAEQRFMGIIERSPDQAVGTYRRLVDLVPTSPQAYFRLAQAEAATQDEDSARISLRRAIELDPEYIPAVTALTEVEARAGRPEEALRVADSLRKKMPDSYVGHMLVGDVLMTEKKYTEATAAYETSITKAQNSALALRLYRARWGAGNRDAALDGLSTWVEENEDDRASRLVLAGGLLNTKRYDEATALYEELADAIPNNAVILNNLAWLYQQKNDPRAVELAERAHESAPDSPRVMDTLGWILVQRGDTARGVDLLEKARDKLPLEPDVLYHYAVGLHRAGRSDEAAKYLRNLVNFYGDFPAIDDAKALLDEIGTAGKDGTSKN